MCPLGTGGAWLVHSLASARAYVASHATCCVCDFCLWPVGMFGGNASLCHTWDMVLACVGVFIRAPQVSFCVSEAQPLSRQCRHLCSTRCCASAFPGNSESRTFPFGRRCARIQDCQSAAASQRRQPEFQSAHRGPHSWLGAFLGICCLFDLSVGSARESCGVPCHAMPSGLLPCHPKDGG